MQEISPVCWQGCFLPLLVARSLHELRATVPETEGSGIAVRGGRVWCREASPGMRCYLPRRMVLNSVRYSASVRCIWLCGTRCYGVCVTDLACGTLVCGGLS